MTVGVFFIELAICDDISTWSTCLREPSLTSPGMITSRSRSIGYVAIMEGLHFYVSFDVGSRIRTTNAILQEHNKPEQIHSPTGSNAPGANGKLDFISNGPSDPYGSGLK